MIPTFVTFFFLFFVTTLKNKDSYILVVRSDKDFIYKISEFSFFFVFLPNVGAIIFGFIFGMVFIFIFILLSSLSRFGFIRLPFNNQRRNDVESNAQIFKKKYLKYLKGHFYIEKAETPTDTLSMKDMQHDFSAKEIDTLYKFKSCDNDVYKVKHMTHPKLVCKTDRCDIENAKSCREDLCCICYLHFRESSYVLTLPECNHVFHYNCIMSWMTKNPSCPVCRKDLLSHFRNIYH